MRSKAAVALLALFTVVAIYGFIHERLYAEFAWSRIALPRIAGYTAVSLASFGFIVWRFPKWIGVIPASVVLLYTIWWSGFAAPLAVIFFLGSCFFVGRRLSRSLDLPTTVLLGVSVWMVLFWTALHFPINRPLVYLVALSIPYVFADASLFRRPNILMTGDRRLAAALSVLLFVLLMHWLIALKPEVSADGLSMHLAFPAEVALNHQWPFDFQHKAWALMPAGADSLFTSVYLLGGESAARLLNLAFLVLIVFLVFLAARRRTTPANSWLVAALFASTPLVQLVTGSLFVENVWAAMIVAATLSSIRYRATKNKSDLYVTAVLIGSALFVKLLAAAFAVLILFLAGVVVFRQRQWRPAGIAAALVLFFAIPPYAFAYARSGNPIFPFLNTVFKSPYWNTEVAFADARYQAKPNWKIPYELTFRSEKFLESERGSTGFQYFLLLAPLLLLIKNREDGEILFIAIGASAIIFLAAPYLRYLYPAFSLVSIAIACLMSAFPSRYGIAGILLLIGLNLYFMPVAGAYDHDFALFRHADIQPYLEKRAPVRLLIPYLNDTGPGEPVALFSTDGVTGIHAVAYTDTWHSQPYWEAVRTASEPSEIAVLFRNLGIRHVIAPTNLQTDFAVPTKFLQSYLDPDGPTIGNLGVFRVRDSPKIQ